MKILLTLFLIFTIPSHSFASGFYTKEALLSIEHYNVPEGLSQSTVTSIIEDKHGYLWIGTLNGLNRFDGTNFKHYFSDESSLPSSFIRSLYIDRNGDLFVGTDKGLAIYDDELDQFKNLDTFDLLKGIPIWSITERNGSLILGSENSVIDVDFKKNNATEILKFNFDGIKKIITRENKLYIKTYNGEIYNFTKGEIKLLEKEIIGLTQYNEDIILTSSSNLKSLFKKNENLERLTIKSISENNNKPILLINNSLYKLEKDYTLENIGLISKDKNISKSPIIHSGDSGIYIATLNNGIYVLRYEKNIIKTFITDKNIWSINNYNTNKFVVTSDSSDIEIYDNKFNLHDVYDSKIDGPKSATIKNDYLYIASPQGLHSINMLSRAHSNISDDKYIIVRTDNHSNIIKAGTFDGKVIFFNSKSGSVNEIIVDEGNPIFDIQTEKNITWVATQSGLFSVNGNTIEKEVSADLVSSIYIDNDILYFGTRNSLSKLTLKDRKIEKLLTNNKPIYAINKVKDTIIASSNAEIFIILDNNKTYTLSSSFGSQDEYNSQAIANIEGNIYIGGIDGISFLQLDEVHKILKKRKAPDVYLDELLIFNIPEMLNNGILKKQLPYTEKIKLKYSDYPFTLKFNSPGNSNKMLEYSYKMEGLSNSWLESKGINSATYTNLSPGEYTFKVHSIDPLTKAFGETKSLRIEITPPWWFSTEAKLVYLIVTLLITGSIVKAFLRRREVQRQIAKSEERLKLSLWGSGDEMWDWDIETGQIYRSNIWGSLEFPRDGQRSGEAGEESNIHPMDQERVNTALNKHFYGETDHFEAAYRVKGKDEQWVWILDRAKIVERDENDKALRMTGTIKNISNFKQAEEQLRLFERAIENISEGMFILDNQFHFVEVNEACCDLCDKSRHDFIGEIFKFDLYPETYSQQIRSILQQQGSWSDEVESARGDGSSFLMELTVDAIYDEQGSLSHYVGVFSDISRRKQQEEELRKLTNNDLLTSLPNRSSLMVTLGNLVRKDTHHTLMVLDLDNFKKINDSLGHQVGDELLIKVARRIEATVPYHTSIYRLGGDEFAILVDNNPDIGSSAVIAHNVVDAFTSPFELTKNKVVVGVSIGIVLYPEDDQNEQALLRKADIAMYHAKSAGGNRYQFYSESLNRNAIRQLEVENLIREGLRDDLFEVYYQPKIDLKSGKMAGMEALVRLNHPIHGLIPPSDFIPLAEENGLIVEIGEVVLRKACFAAQNWRRQAMFNGRVAVNLSSLQFALPDLQQRIESILRLTQLPAANLELEITEGTVIKQPEKAIKVMMQLSKMGVSLALDDFGTGYSSLSYLKRFPIDTLKIDKAFVDDIDKSDRDLKMVDSIITIAHNMGLSVVGEGVEDASQLSILKALKCEEIQGFIFSKAVCESDFTELLRRDAITPHAIHMAQTRK